MLAKNIKSLKGIGSNRAEVLRKEANIETVEDLLYYKPRKYIDRSALKQIKDCFVNETVTLLGTIISIGISGRRKKHLEVIIDDGSDTLCGVFFGGIPFFKKIFKVGDTVLFSGKIKFYRTKQIVHPDFDFIDTSSKIQAINTGRIIPLYRSTESLKSAGFDSRGFRRIIKSAIDEYLDHVIEPFHKTILNKYNLMSLKEALLAIHFPDSYKHAEDARKRLAFNEIFFFQYYLHLSKRYLRDKLKKNQRHYDNSIYKEFFMNLPFKLTEDQIRSIEEIKNDILSPGPMNRLLQGDVGSGKTVVAMAASSISIGRGCQVAYMAPTEVLAHQQYQSFCNLLPDKVNISLLTGSLTVKEKEDIYSSLKKHEIDIIIGTHALIQEGVSFNNLGLIIIDEQQRFGVEQRAELRRKGDNTDILIMTATPIPRSLSMTFFGDLDISIIKTKPANRIPVKTLSFPESRLNAVYNSMQKYLDLGRQVYYVLPLIEESEKIDLKSAIKVYENLKENIFPQNSVALIHGKMKQNEKEDIMRRFYGNEIDILVSTTVIEVGIDVPNATIIVIEHAERFGLSQLHQLRGRVGRGENQSFCILIHPEDISDESMKRINIIVDSNDGFKISEEDLKLRGAGQLIGIRQHGYSNDFEFIDFAGDSEIISDARDEAEKTVAEIDDIDTIFNDFQNLDRKDLLNSIRSKKILSILS